MRERAKNARKQAEGATRDIAVAQARTLVEVHAQSSTPTNALIAMINGADAAALLAAIDAARAKLPWYAQWSFFGPALLLVGACAAKDALGAVVPPGSSSHVAAPPRIVSTPVAVAGVARCHHRPAPPPAARPGNLGPVTPPRRPGPG